MEFAHLNATLRSAYFPPYDPWFADGYINYYYFGLYLVAFTLKLTGIPSEIGFNLAQPTVIALLASTAFSVAATLGRDLTRLPRLGIPSGILGTLMVLFIGNLTTLGQLLSFEWPPFDSFDDWTWRGSRAIVTAITEFPYFTALYADLHAHVVALPVTILAIALSYAVARDGQLLFASAASVTRRGAWRIFGARLVLLMLVIGLLLPINAWDVPVYAALAIAALWMCSAALSDWRWRIAGVGSAALLLGMGAYATIRPFQDHYVALFSSLELVREPTPFTEAASHVGGLLAIALLGLALIALPRDAPSIWPLNMPGLVVATLVLLIMAGNTVALVQPVYATAIIAVSLVAVASLVLLISWVRIASAVVNVWQRWLLLGAAALAVAAILLALARGQMVLAGYLIVAGLALLNWVLGTTTAVRFVSLMVLAASLVGAGAELFLVADDLLATTAYRMNTIFKFYNQIWILLAVSGAALVTRMALDSRWFGRSRSHAERRSGESLRQGWARAGLVVAAIVIAGSLTYPVFATLPRLQQRFEPNLGSGTLNALDWMDTGQVPSFGPDGLRQISFADDRAAINWLNENVAGSPVIAEASIGPYRCNGSRVSIATGLPTIIGWERHQQQQRYPDALGARVEDVRTLYTSPDPTGKEEILRKYNVEYVVVGDLERIYPVASNDCQPTGSAAGIAVFDDMIGSTLSVAFAHGGTTIYRVLPVTPS